jgi:hypothetical protein
MKQLLIIWVVVLAIIGIWIFGWLVSEARKSNTATQNDPQEIIETTPENEPKPSESSAINLPPLSVENLSANEKQVHFPGASFIYNSSLFSDVKAEKFFANPFDCANCKVDGMDWHPEYIHFQLLGDYSEKHKDSTEPEIVIFKIEDYKQAFSLSESLVQEIDKQVVDLKRLLAKKLIPQKDNLPYLDWFDASQAFHSHIKQIKFQNGKGLLYLTKYVSGIDIIDNENLAYLFQGITDDGKYSVRAWFPVEALTFPHDEYQLPDNFFEKSKAEANQRALDAYYLRMQHKFNALPPDAYKPNLSLLEKLIRSIRVEKDSQ